MSSELFCKASVAAFLDAHANSALLDEKWRCRSCGRFAAEHTISREDTVPPYRLSTYVIFRKSVLKDDSQPILVCGTAVAIKSETDDILFTAGHVIASKESGYTFHCASSISREGDTSYPSTWTWSRAQGEVFPVTALLVSVNPDIAVLRRTDGGRWKSAMPLCNPSQLPWLLRPKDWACKAYAFHCPAEMVENIPIEYVHLRCVVDEVVVQSHTNYYCVLNKAFLPGSSGGAIVLADGSLLGILVKENRPTVATTKAHTDINDSDGRKGVDEGDDVPSLSSNNDARIPSLTAVLLMPSLLQLRRGDNTVPLQQWLLDASTLNDWTDVTVESSVIENM